MADKPLLCFACERKALFRHRLRFRGLAVQFALLFFFSFLTSSGKRRKKMENNNGLSEEEEKEYELEYNAWIDKWDLSDEIE